MTTKAVNQKAVAAAIETFDSLAANVQAPRQAHMELARHVEVLKGAAERLKELEAAAAVSKPRLVEGATHDQSEAILPAKAAEGSI